MGIGRRALRLEDFARRVPDAGSRTHTRGMMRLRWREKNKLFRLRPGAAPELQAQSKVTCAVGLVRLTLDRGTRVQPTGVVDAKTQRGWDPVTLGTPKKKPLWGMRSGALFWDFGFFSPWAFQEPASALIALFLGSPCPAPASQGGAWMRRDLTRLDSLVAANPDT